MYSAYYYTWTSSQYSDQDIHWRHWRPWEVLIGSYFGQKYCYHGMVPPLFSRKCSAVKVNTFCQIESVRPISNSKS